jgi:hypothetical protein
MPSVTVRLALLREFSAHRPPGYVDDVLSRGTLPGDGTVVLPVEAYEALRDKYDVSFTRGPGTELKAMLKTIGIVATAGCSCNSRAKTMDERGCDWCDSHIDEIDGWLAEEAGKRGLPYISLAGKTLIRLAIRRARKKGNK